MSNKLKVSILLIAVIGFILITLTGCSNNSVAGTSGDNNIFAEGTVYAIEGEFNIHREGGIVYGTFFVEVLETNDKWIRVDVLGDENVDLGESEINRAKDEGLFEDFWINTEKIHYVMTEPDF